MKKCAYFLILIFAMGLFSCSGSVVSSTDESHDNFTIKKMHSVCLLDSTDKNSPKYETDISIKLLESDDKERATKINNTILYAIFGYENLTPEAAMDSFVSHAHEEYADLRPEYYNVKEINESTPWFNFSYIIYAYLSYIYYPKQYNTNSLSNQQKILLFSQEDF